jgi:RNA polymerase sigma-70 factor (ECF subfamily)
VGLHGAAFWHRYTCARPGEEVGRVPTTLEDLYREHAAPVWRYVRARLPGDADAEDVTSDVFLRAHRSLDRFDPAQGTPRAWLVGIARHATADWWRKRGLEDPMAELPTAEDPADDALGHIERLEAAGELARHLAVLSPREREAISLRFAAELPSAEVGAALGISPTAARMLVHRAVVKLREVVDHG